MMDEAVERVRKVRSVPKRFGMIDERVVSEGYLRRLCAEAVSLYVFLCVVANREGRSWYSDGRLVQMVRLSSLAGARRQLVEAGLIRWERPVYTVCDVPEAAQEGPTPERAVEAERAATKEEVAEVMEAIRRKLGRRR